MSDATIQSSNIYENEQLFRILAEHTNVGIFLYNQDKVIYVNPAFERVTGYKLEDLDLTNGLKAIHENDRQQIAERIKKRFLGEAVPNEYELQYLTKSGEHRWADISVSLVQFQGQPYGLVTGVDITERKHAEEKIKQSEIELRRILNNMLDTYYRTDLQGHIINASHSAHELLGYEEHEIYDLKLADLYVDPNGREKFLKLLQDNNGVVKNYQAPLKRKDGSIIWVSTNAHFCFDSDGNVIGVEGTTRDVTELISAHEELRSHRDHLEELINERTLDLEAANRELESFCYSVSHDLRAPLRSIDGFSQILIEDYGEQLDDVFKEHLQRVRSGAQRMGQLIDDLLKLSRVSSGGIKKETVNLSSIAQEIIVALQQTDPHRNVEIHIEDNLCATCDPILIRSVLENLLGNAWKYTNHNQTNAVIEFGYAHKNKSFFVKDNGVGFDMKYANKLFGAFQRLHHFDEFEGSGIGLATVHRIIQRHGGKVWAEGNVNEGATFYFTLPGSANCS
ncbi:sensor histidine kinase [Kaarinaea lacus]